MLKKIAYSICLATMLNANINTVVSILPEKTFVKMIGQDKVNITLMVKPGNSPHTYEPKPTQMQDISNANIYFSIGVEFEKVWIQKFITQNNNMKVVDLSKGINKTSDPHIWLNTQNVEKIIFNIYQSLAKFDSQNKDFYKQNYNKFLLKIKKTDNLIVSILKDLPYDTKFMVFHPSWGYFAKQYHLIQLPIEIDGKNPKPRQIVLLMRKAKQENIKAIFVSPEFSTKLATQIAKELNVKVIKISPLNPNWSQNLINFAKGLK